MLEILVGIVVLLVSLSLTRKLQRKWSSFPPGPEGLPVVGNLLELARSSQPMDAFQGWADTYGDVVGLQLGQYRVVLLSNFETIKEAYSKPEFSGRPLLLPFHALTGGSKLGLVLSEGQPWTEQRRFALRNLRDFGFGKKSMESVIHEDIQELIDHFKELENQPFVPHRKFSTAVVKSLWAIIAGEKFTYGDPRFQSVLDALHAIISGTSLGGPVLFFPALATLLPGPTGWTTLQKAMGRARSLISGFIEDHKKTYQSHNVRDYIDVYLKEIEDTTDSRSSFYKETGDKHLLVGTLNLFGAGSETTSNTIVWALLYLIKHPEEQEKLFKEISSITGLSRLPSLDDREKCPYALAVMEEVLRLSSLTPLGVIHSTMENVTFHGYSIPKDTLIFANLYGVHHSKQIWGDPEAFRPQRFLNPDGTLKKNPGPVVAFSVGKRECLGMTLARNNFFLYLTSLIQKFKFTAPANHDLQTTATAGLIRTPLEFKIILQERPY